MLALGFAIFARYAVRKKSLALAPVDNLSYYLPSYDD
jgi:hypothetical protein